MRYYFAQHGKALPSDIDASRSLSAEGKQQTQTIAGILKNNNVRITQIVHSGKERAAQTAEIITASLGIKTSNKMSGMSPNDDARSFVEIISNTDFDNTLFIGHLPHLQKVVSYLLNENASSNFITFQNSAVLCLETDKDKASILWYITPDII